MNEIKEKIGSIRDQIQQKRDELKLKIHLGKAEAKDEWERLEDKRKDLMQKADAIDDVIDDAAQEAGVAIELGFQELKDAYAEIKKKIAE